MEPETCKVQKRRIEVQQTVQLKQASFMDAMRNMLAEFMRDNSQSESVSA